MKTQRSTLQSTLDQIKACNAFGIPGVFHFTAGTPKQTIVINACTFGTELNGLRGIQRVLDLANMGKLRNAAFFLVVANLDAALAGVDDFGRSLNRLLPDFALLRHDSRDMARANDLATFFQTQKIDVVVDFQENPLVSRNGVVVDIAGEPELLNTVCDSLRCPDRLMGITAVQQSAQASGTSPFATIYNAKAAIEVLLPSTSREDGSVERIVDALLVGLGVLAPRAHRSDTAAQDVYQVVDAYSGVKDRKYAVADTSLLNMAARVKKGDVLAVCENESGDIVARSDGALIFGPRARNFVGNGNEVWWQVVQGETRVCTIRPPDI